MSRDLVPAENYACPFTRDMDDEKEYFCYQYAIDSNPQLAAERCGITLREARRYVRDPMVQKAVADIRSRVMARCEIKIEDIVNELKRIAFFDIKGIVDDDGTGTVKEIPLSEIDGRAISEIKVTDTRNGKMVSMFKPHRKLDALKVLLEYATGNLGNNVNVQVNIGDVKKADPESAMDVFNQVMEGAIIQEDNGQGP